MNDFLSRRLLLKGIGTTAVCGSLASQLATLAQAGEAEAPAVQEMVYTTMFMTGKKTKFDSKKYVTKHLPLLKQSFGDSVSRIEMRTGNATARGQPTDVGVTTSVYIADLQGFIKALQANIGNINSDLDAAATGPRNVQIDRLLHSFGQPRSELRENHQVLSTYYLDKASDGKGDSTFDTKYFLDVYLPKMRSYYGDSAVRRVEVFTGVQQGPAKPMFTATMHLYIRERDAYNSANGEGQKELMKIDDKYTNAQQMWGDSKITAIL